MRIIFSVIFSALWVNYFQGQVSNDQPCDAINIEVGDSVYTVDNTDATADSLEPFPIPFLPNFSCYLSWCNDALAVENSVWYSFVAPPNGAVIISTCNDLNTVDTQLALWHAEDCSDYSTFVLVSANDDMFNGCGSGEQYSSTIGIDTLVPGDVYYIQVDGWQADAGSIGINVAQGSPNSQVNFIHNSGDQFLSSLEIWIDGELISADFNYRTCTGFIEIPADDSIEVSLCAPGSVNDSMAYYSAVYHFDSMKDYVMVLDGIYSSSGYITGPNTDLQFFQREDVKILTDSIGYFPLLFFHGVTDAPPIDLVDEQNTMWVNDLEYGEYSQNYVYASAANTTLNVNLANGTPLLSLCGQFTNLFPGAFTVVASGFANPADNSNGPSPDLMLVDHFQGILIPLIQGACPIPDNDDLCNAQELTVNSPAVSFDNSFATVQSGEVSCFNLPNNDPESDCLNAWCDGTLDNTLWFYFVAPSDSQVVVSTCFDDAFDTQVAVAWVNDCADFSSVSYIAANDDMEGGCSAGDPYASHVIMMNSLIPGEIYYVQVDGFEGAIGSGQIQVTSSMPIGIDEMSDIKAKVYPNPASEFILVHSNNTMLAQLTDSQARLCYQGTLTGNGRIDISNPRFITTRIRNISSHVSHHFFHLFALWISRTQKGIHQRSRIQSILRILQHTWCKTSQCRHSHIRHCLLNSLT